VQGQIEKKLYVHQMLTEFRTDYIPFYANPRHVKTVHREKYKGSDVFADVLQSD